MVEPVSTGVSVAGAATGVAKEVSSGVFSKLYDWFYYSDFAVAKKIRHQKDAADGQSTLTRIAAEEIGKQALADPAYMEAQRQRILGPLFARDANKEAVLQLTQEEIIKDGGNPDDLEMPDDDWRNTFSRAAEDASSDELRKRLADLLAGEIRKPGTFSKPTVRLVAELDRDLLIEFQKLLDFEISGQIPVEDSWNQGEHFNLCRRLVDAGLISSGASFTHASIIIDGAGIGLIYDEGLGLGVKSTEPNRQIQFSVWIFTQAGVEISKLLPRPDHKLAAFQRLSNLLPKGGLTQMIVGPVVQLPNGQQQVSGAITDLPS